MTGLKRAIDELQAAAECIEGEQSSRKVLNELLTLGPLPRVSLVVFATEDDQPGYLLEWLLAPAPHVERETTSDNALVASPPRQEGAEARIAQLKARARVAGWSECVVITSCEDGSSALASLTTQGHGLAFVIVAPNALERAMRLFARATCAFWPVDLEASLSGRTKAVDLLEGFVLPILVVDDPFVGQHAENAFWSPAHEIHELLRNIYPLLRMQSIAKALAQQQQTEVQDLHSQLKRENLLPRPGVDDDQIKSVVERARGEVAEAIARLSASLREAGRKAGLKTGTIFKFADELLGNISVEDLNREIAAKKIRLTLRADVIEEVRGAFAVTLGELLASDVEELRRATGLIHERLRSVCETLSIDCADLQVWTIDADHVSHPILEGMHLHPRYRGEVKRRGFLQRLAEGRRAVFVVLMIGSLFGGFLGFNVRRIALMGPLFLAMFAVSVAYTFRSWKDEERVIFEDELIRVREALGAECSRIIYDFVRERQARLQTVVDDVRRDSLVRLDFIQRKAIGVTLSTQQANRTAARAQSKVLEGRARELQHVGLALASTRAMLDRLLATASREMATVLLGRQKLRRIASSE